MTPGPSSRGSAGGAAATTGSCSIRRPTGTARPDRPWRLETDLDPLLADCRAILSPDGFLLLTAHTEHLGEDQLAGRLGLALRRAAGDIEAGDLRLDATSGASLGLGAFARWDGAR